MHRSVGTELSKRYDGLQAQHGAEPQLPTATDDKEQYDSEISLYIAYRAVQGMKAKSKKKAFSLIVQHFILEDLGC